MKKLLLITMLIGGCATTQLTTTDYQRESICKLDNRDSYWGDCYIENILNDLNFEAFSKWQKKERPKSADAWEVVTYTNQKILNWLTDETINYEDANTLFALELESYNSTKEQELAEIIEADRVFSEKLQKLSATLRESNANKSGYNNNSSIKNNSEPAKLGRTYKLKSSYEYYSRKVCVYAHQTDTKTFTVSGMVNCPPYKYFGS